jgi:hypothetical protein
MSFEGQIDDRIQQRMPRTDESGQRLPLWRYQCFFKGDALVAGQHWLTDANQPVAISYRGWNVGDLIAAGFPLFVRSAQSLKRFAKEGFDVVRLQAAGFGALHIFADPVDLACVHGINGKGVVFKQILNLFAIQYMIQHRRQAGANLRLIPVSDCPDQQIPKWFALELELAENIENLAAKGLAGLLQLFQKPVIHIPFTGLFGHQVPQMAYFGLADAVDTAKTLLNAVGVPRQIVIDHKVGTLEIDALTRSIRGKQHIHHWVMFERFLRFHTILAAHTSMDHDHGFLAAQQCCNPELKIIQCIPMLGKKNQFLVG